MSENDNKTGVQPATTSTPSGSSSTSASTSTSSTKTESRRSESSESKGSGRKGRAVYDQGDTEPKSPNSKADARGPVTKIEDGDGNKNVVYPGMTVGYSSGKENPYDEGSYVSDSVNSFYENRARNGVDLPS